MTSTSFWRRITSMLNMTLSKEAVMGWRKFFADLLDDNTLIIIGVILLAWHTDTADISKYVVGGLIGYLKASVSKEATIVSCKEE